MDSGDMIAEKYISISFCIYSLQNYIKKRTKTTAILPSARPAATPNPRLYAAPEVNARE